MKVTIYVDKTGFSPFKYWLENLQNNVKTRILIRLDRIQEGNLGDHKYLSQSIWELRFNFGSGIRIYYFRESADVILIIWAGDKSTQKNDIKKAIHLLEKYLGI